MGSSPNDGPPKKSSSNDGPSKSGPSAGPPKKSSSNDAPSKSDECVDENAKADALCGKQCSDLKSFCGTKRHYCKKSRKEVNVEEFCPKTCGKFCGTGDNNKFARDVC